MNIYNFLKVEIKTPSTTITPKKFIGIPENNGEKEKENVVQKVHWNS
jgi:hypothetical protein